jgi:hypothetical protein
MYHAGDFIDNLADIPPAIDDEVRRILGVKSWEDRVEAILDVPQAAAHLTRLAATFRAESQRNARECLLEGDWKASLNGLVRNLAHLWPGALKTDMSEKGKVAGCPKEFHGQDAYLNDQSGIPISSPPA